MFSKDTLTGELIIGLIVSAVLTALVSLCLLWLYRRTVVRAMSKHAHISSTPKEPAMKLGSERINKSTDITIVDSALQPETAYEGESIYWQAMRSLNRSTLVYTIGGLFYALVMTSAWMIAAKGGFSLSRFLWLFSCYSWPVILAVIVINPFIRKRILIIYCTITLFIACIALVRSPDITVVQLVYLWLFANVPGMLLLAAFMNRRVRAVGPLVLAFMVIAVTGSVFFVNIIGSKEGEGLLHGFAIIGSMMGLRAITLFILFFVIGFGLFGLLGWQLLRWLGYRYEKKKMSDQSITIDALWLIFCVVQSITLVFEDWWWIFTGLVAFVVYKVIVKLGYIILSRQNRNIPEDRRLLLLRVFSLGRRSERLFDTISKVWLRSGCINLIAGPDLVTSTVEPHEFLHFMGGHLSQQFVSGEEDLKQRISNMDTLPDPDGRHRVIEFFCHSDTWRMTMQWLAKGSDVVLMDLRNFSEKNKGCTYELQQLFNYIPLHQIILIVDDTTDQIFLKETVKTLCQQITPDSPNLEIKDRRLGLFTLRKKGLAEAEKLLMLLFKIQNS